MNFNTKTVKQYLIDITLKTLEFNIPIQSPSKAICEIHYGDNYLKLKLQPTIKNNSASFYEERIRIPYSAQVALVFKMQKVKKEIFVGHCMIDAQKSLQQRIYSFKKREKLQETDAYIDFEVKIIDKELFEDAGSDEQVFDEDPFQTDKSLFSAIHISKTTGMKQTKTRSLINGPFIAINKENGINVVTPSAQQFAKCLSEAQQIVKKHQLLRIKDERLQYFKKDKNGVLSTQRIEELKQKLRIKRQEIDKNANYVMIIIAIISFAIGFIMH